MKPYHFHSHWNAHSTATPRRGTVLLLVLVVVAILALGAYTFSEQMVSETEAAHMHGRQAETRAFADSGLELVAAVLENEETRDTDINNNPSQFRSIVMRESQASRGRGLFSVVASLENDPGSTTVRYGLMDESARLNLNAIPGFGLSDNDARNMLMYLPGMTEELADAILDWVDSDETTREFGAESDYYSSLDPPVVPPNGPLRSLEELLQVDGVTVDLLYGEDTNRNGILDPNEDDGAASEPADDADGVLNPGWAAFLTVRAKELNQRSDGTARLYVNDGVLTDLYDKLMEEFDDENIAKYVVAMRLAGPRLTAEEQAEQQQQDSGTTGVSSGTSGGGTSPASGGNSRSGSSSAGSSSASGGNTSGGGTSAGSTSGSNSSGRNNSGSNTAQTASALTTLATNVGQAIGGAPGGAVSRGGMDLSQGSKYELKSLYDLIGSEVEIVIDGTRTVLESPWKEDPTSLASDIPLIFDILTTYEGDQIPGRINVNQARLETLLGIPGMTEDMANAIVGGSPSAATGIRTTDAALQGTSAWLLTRGITDAKTMSKLDRYLTGRGHVFKAQVVGYFEQGGGHTRLEAIIDASSNPAKILTVTDLTELGRGFGQNILAGTSDGSP